MISQKSIQEVIDTARIEEVVEDFVNLKRRGVNMLGLCPFHDEKTPSFTVSPAKNIYKCFGCGNGGDAITFIKEHEGVGYVEAIRYLARKYGIVLEETEDTREQKEEKQKNDSYYIINEYAKDYFVKQLFDGQEGRAIGLSYFKERGFNEATIKKFDLGYAPGDYKAFVDHATAKSLNLDHAQALGLVSKKGNDFFRSRVMFTIHNLSGKIIAFAGRTLSSDKKVPKYINSPESDIYNKRKILYGMYQARQAIRKADECIIVEGYTDVISLHQNSVENVVAASGTSLTDGQIRLIKRYTKNVKIIFDGDSAGIKAALRGLDMILNQDMNVKLVLLPEGEDPDSFMAQKGSSGFSQYLEDEAQDFVIFKTNLLLKDAGDDPIKRSQVLKDIVDSISMIPDMLKRSVYIKECSRILDIQEDTIVRATNKVIRKRIEKEHRDAERKAPVLRDENQALEAPTESTQEELIILKGKDEYKERDIVRVLMHHGMKNLSNPEINVSKFIISNIKDFVNYIDNPTYQSIVKEVIDMMEKNQKIETKYFLSHPDKNIRSTVIDLISTPYVYAGWDEKDMRLQSQKEPDSNQQRDVLSSLKYFLVRKIQKNIKEVEELIKESAKGDDPETLNRYLQLLTTLLAKRNEIAEDIGIVTLH